MATSTKNLALLKKDVTTDGNDTFNIKAMLNDNWDKIDDAVSKKASATDLTNLSKEVAKKANTTDLTSLSKEVSNITTNIDNHLDGTSHKTVAIQHGLTVIEGAKTSPANVEVQGKTLVNLIYGVSPFTIELDTSKYYVLINDGNSAVTINDVSRTVPYKFTKATTAKIVWAKGNPALYEVTKDDYDKILTTWDKDDVIKRYPYVKDAQHLQGISLVADGVNLLPPVTEARVHTTSKLIVDVVSQYHLEATSNVATSNASFQFNVMPNKVYSFNADHNLSVAVYTDDASKAIRSYSTEKTFTFNSVDNTVLRLYIRVPNANEKYYFKNGIINFGETAKPFVPRSQSSLFADVKLGEIGTTKDILYKDNGRWLLRKAIEKDVELDGSLDWVIHTNKTGCKTVKATAPININAQIPDTNIREDISATKFNGKLLKNETTKNMWGHDVLAEKDVINIDEGKLIVVLPNDDTGFSETFSPTSQEIKAYLNGWQVKTIDVSNKPTAWKSIVTGADAATQTLAYVSANKAPGYTPYKLSYVLTTPQIIDVTDKVEGDILVNGLTQIELNSGVIVREKVKPSIDPSSCNINHMTSTTNSKLKYKSLAILKIYKNGIPDDTWSIISDSNAYGAQRAYCSKSTFDPTAEYTVTYQALDRHQITTNATDITLTYSDSTRSSIDDIAIKQAHVERVAQDAIRHTSATATTAQKGHVQLSNVVSTDQTTAITPKAVNDALHDIKDNVNKKADTTALNAVSAKINNLETSDNLVNIESGWEVGAVSLTLNKPQTKIVSTVRLRYFDNPVEVTSNAIYSLVNENLDYVIAIHEFDSDMNVIVDSSWILEKYRKYTMSANTKYVRFFVRTTANSTVTLEDVKKTKFSLVKGDIYQAWKPSQIDAFTKIDSAQNDVAAVTKKIDSAETAVKEINDTRMLKVLKTNKDSEGIYKTVTYKRKANDTTYCVSTLSGGVTPLYTTKTEQYYNAAGTSVIATHVYSLSYDDDDNLISEV